jgi:HNH endonuclease
MARLRSEAYERSGGICECQRPSCLARPYRLRRVSFNDGHLHHVISRARGGSDVIGNVQFITRKCHEEIHGIPLWSYNSRDQSDKGIDA